MIQCEPAIEVSVLTSTKHWGLRDLCETHGALVEGDNLDQCEHLKGAQKTTYFIEVLQGKEIYELEDKVVERIHHHFTTRLNNIRRLEGTFLLPNKVRAAKY